MNLNSVLGRLKRNYVLNLLSIEPGARRFRKQHTYLFKAVMNKIIRLN